MKKSLLTLLAALFLISCGDKETTTSYFNELTKDSPFLHGKEEYLNSPMVTAGDRVYSVGHQNGSFPELGWHIKDEMGGIWNHPIKLMDGFDILLHDGKNDEVLSLDTAHTFTNYPYANKHSYRWETQEIEVERWQFVPDGKEGMVVQLVLQNLGDAKSIQVQLNAFSDLRPTWLGERTQMKDGKDIVDSFNKKHKAWIVKDSLNPWYTMIGSDLLPSEYGKATQSPYTGKGVTLDLVYDIALGAHERAALNFIIAGSYTSEKELVKTFESIQNNIATDLISKRERYEALAQKSRLTIPDKEIEKAYEWVKYNCDWLVRTVPEIGSGIGAGIPDYPWWFGVDSEYALQGYMAVGQTEPVLNTIRLLDSVSNVVNGNGRIIHEMSTNGAVFNPGNINETPQFASLIWKIYQWNGDREFLEKYFPTVEKGMEWLLTEKDANGNGFPDGFGMMEIHGMDSEMIDVAAYTQKALVDASEMAKALDKEELSKRYDSIARKIKDDINTQFWSEEFKSYADFIGTDEQALWLIDDAIVRADTLNKPWAVEELKETREAILKNPSLAPRPFVLHHNWVVNTPMEVNIAPMDKASAALTTAERFVNPFGVFVTGIDRDDSAGSDDGSFKGSEIFSYTGAVMTLPTGVQIVAENNYGRPDKALNYLQRMTRTFGYALPGSIYEVSPDYGMMTQAWNIYGYGVPVVEQFFGIKPDAARQKVVIQPQMPIAWDEASLENIAIGNNEVSVFYNRKQGETTIKVIQTKNNWDLEIQLAREPGSEFEVITGTVVDSMGEGYYLFESKDKQMEIVIYDGES